MRRIFEVSSWARSERTQSVSLDGSELVVEIRTENGPEIFRLPFREELLRFLEVYLRRSIYAPKSCVVGSILELERYFSQSESPELEFDSDLEALFACRRKKVEVFWIRPPSDDFDVVRLSFNFEVEDLRPIDGAVLFARGIAKERRASGLNFSVFDFLAVFPESGPPLLASVFFSRAGFYLCLEARREESLLEVRLHSCISGYLSSLETRKFSLEISVGRREVVERALFEFGKEVLRLSDPKKGLVLPQSPGEAFLKAYAASSASLIFEKRSRSQKRLL